MSATVPPSIILPQDLQTAFIHAVQQLHVIRYVTVSVYIVLLLEHLTSIPQEVEFLWKAPWSLARVCFLLYRYSTIAGLTILMHVMAGLSGPLELNLFVFLYFIPHPIDVWYSCKHAIAAMVALSAFSMGTADGLVMLRVSVLWGRQPVILAILFLSFIVTYSIAVVCTVVAAIKLISSTMLVPIVNLCAPFAKPYAMFGVWAPGMVFDALVLAMTSWNACAQPRTQQTALTQAMYRDGVAFFLVLAGLRAFNLFLTIFSPLFLVGVCIAWPLSAITLSRFVFHLRSLERGQPHDNLHEFDFVDPERQSMFEAPPPHHQELHSSLRGQKLDGQSQCGTSTQAGSEWS